MNNNKDLFESLLKYLAIVLFIIGLIIAIPTYFTILTNSYGRFTDYGNVGSYIGGVVGSLWSLTGVLLFFIALRLQKKELELQINELKETKETFIQQNFENTFFNLLNRQQQILNNVEHHYYHNFSSIHDLNQSGVKFFVNAMRALKNLYQLIKTTDFEQKKVIKQKISSTDISEKEINVLQAKFTKIDDDVLFVKEIYLFFMDKYYQQFGHYLRHLYNILKYIKSKEKSFSTQQYDQYISILKSQLSTAELFFVFYNGFAFPKMKEMINEFKLIEHLPNAELIDPLHDSFYSVKTTISWIK